MVRLWKLSQRLLALRFELGFQGQGKIPGKEKNLPGRGTTCAERGQEDTWIVRKELVLQHGHEGQWQEMMLEKYSGPGSHRILYHKLTWTLDLLQGPAKQGSQTTISP